MIQTVRQYRWWLVAVALVGLLLLLPSSADAHHGPTGTFYKCSKNGTKSKGTTRVHVHHAKPSRRHTRRHKCVKKVRKAHSAPAPQAQAQTVEKIQVVYVPTPAPPAPCQQTCYPKPEPKPEPKPCGCREDTHKHQHGQGHKKCSKGKGHHKDRDDD